MLSAGPTIEGVFRVPGIVSQIEEMREQFIDEDKDPLFGNEEQKKTYDIHAVGSLLKQYLRDLPEPVFPFSTFQRIVDVQTKTGKWLSSSCVYRCWSFPLLDCFISPGSVCPLCVCLCVHCVYVCVWGGGGGGGKQLSFCSSKYFPKST